MAGGGEGRGGEGVYVCAPVRCVHLCVLARARRVRAALFLFVVSV